MMMSTIATCAAVIPNAWPSAAPVRSGSLSKLAKMTNV